MERVLMAGAAAALLAAGCSKVSEKEPNDHFTNATALAAGRSAHGTIGSAGDADWYRVAVARAGALSAHVGGIRDVDFVLSVHGADRAELKRLDETAAGGDERALNLGVEPGEYYLVLSNKNPKADNPRQEYVLATRLATGAWEREPNDRALSASRLEPGVSLRGHFFPSRDLLAEGEPVEEDWFRVSIATPGLYVLNLDVSEVPGVDAVLEVYDVNAYKVREADNGGPGEAESLRNFGVRGPAELTLRLRAKGRSANAEAPYAVVSELLPYQGRAEFEPNDQRLEATPFESESVSGNISQPGDADWYKVSVASETRGLLRAELAPVPGMDLQLAVMDEVGRPLLIVDNMGKEQPEVIPGLGLGQGHADYYLVVSEKSGRKAESRQGYTLTRTVSPFQSGLEWELNDSSMTAQAVRPGESVDGYVAPKGDQDWYEFNIYQKGRATLELTGVLNVRFGLALFDQEYRELGVAAGAKAGESLRLEAELEPGTYAARLRAEDPGQNNVRDKYTFRVTVR